MIRGCRLPTPECQRRDATNPPRSEHGRILTQSGQRCAGKPQRVRQSAASSVTALDSGMRARTSTHPGTTRHTICFLPGRLDAPKKRTDAGVIRSAVDEDRPARRAGAQRSILPHGLALGARADGLCDSEEVWAPRANNSLQRAGLICSVRGWARTQLLKFRSGEMLSFSKRVRRRWGKAPGRMDGCSQALATARATPEG